MQAALYSIYSMACTCSALSKSCEEKQRRARTEVRGSWPYRNIWRHPIRIFGTATRHFQFSMSSLVFSRSVRLASFLLFPNFFISDISFSADSFRSCITFPRSPRLTLNAAERENTSLNLLRSNHET